MMLLFLFFLITTKATLNSNDIICPVLAAMYNNNDLSVDSGGNVELVDLYNSLVNKLGVNTYFAQFQSLGVVAYHKNDTQNLHRSRLMSLQKDVRYLNIFNMAQNENVRHGFGSGFRLNYNSIDFTTYISQFADDNSRFYYEQLNNMICYNSKNGVKQGEFSDSYFTNMRQWQMHLAVHGMLEAFGRTEIVSSEQIGDDYLYEKRLYLTLDDMRDLYIDGMYPQGWRKREWGCLIYGCDTSALSVMINPLNCD